MKDLEFYIYGKELWCVSSDGKNELLTENNVTLVQYMIGRIRDFYPEAYRELAKWFERSSGNVPYFQFLIVDQFCRCNFGKLDGTSKDIDEDGNFHFEKGYCPLYGRCQHENIVCHPKFNSRISDAEIRVMNMVFKGFSNDEIAEHLYLSPHTVKNHIKAVYAKLNIHEKSEFIQYAHTNNLFKE